MYVTNESTPCHMMKVFERWKRFHFDFKYASQFDRNQFLSANLQIFEKVNELTFTGNTIFDKPFSIHFYECVVKALVNV